jgi:hypothetical protein
LQGLEVDPDRVAFLQAFFPGMAIAMLLALSLLLFMCWVREKTGAPPN